MSQSPLQLLTSTHVLEALQQTLHRRSPFLFRLQVVKNPSLVHHDDPVPSETACCIEWVTIIVVRRSLCTISCVTRMT